MASGLQCRLEAFPGCGPSFSPVSFTGVNTNTSVTNLTLGTCVPEVEMTQWALKKFKALVSNKGLGDGSLTFYLARRIISSGMWNANVTLNDIMWQTL